MLNIPYEVQQALRKGDMRKNYKMKVNDVDPDTGERTYLYTIDNDSLVSESVKVDERMVTGKVLKFGLCEGSSLEFQYFDHPNINGKDVQVYCSVEYVDGNGDVAWYDIPMGWYTVDQCPMQWETGIYKVTAYNKLKSSYLDQKANDLLLETLVDPSLQLTVYSIRKALLEKFEIEPYVYKLLDQYLVGSGRPNLIIKNAKLGDLTSDDGPINYYSLSNAAARYSKTITINSTLKIYITTKSVSWRINSESAPYFNNKMYQFMQSVHDFGNLTTRFGNYLEQLLDDSALSKTGSEIVNNIKNLQEAWSGSVSRGWQEIFGITIEDANTYTLIKSFNDYAYIYQNDGTYRVDGSIDDLSKQIINPDPTNNLDYCLYIPQTLWVELVEGYDVYPLLGLSLIGDDPISYIGSGGVTKTYPQFKYDDDTAIAESMSYPFSDWFNLYEISGLSSADLIMLDPMTMPEFTLRDITSASYETVCQYGKLDRETDLFTGVELNQGGLYPADTLYPDNALYPQGNMEHPFPSTYSKLWTDTVGEQSFRYLIITYKAMENGQEVEKTLQRTVNADGTTNYNMSDNWLFRNLVWSDADVGDYADAMVLKMKDVRWFPFEMWCAGLPYVETGDAIEITDKQGNTHTSYVLTRTLDGIHNLQDTFINGELDIF